MTNPYGPPSGPQSFGQPSGGFPQQPGQPVPQYGAPAGGYPPGYHPLGELASWGTRVLGYLVDTVLPYLAALVLMIVFLLLGALLAVGVNEALAGAFMLLGYFLSTGGLIAFMIWNRWYRMGNTGQSLGQKMVKIKTVSEQTGQPIGFGNAFLRDLCHTLDWLVCYVGFLAPLWDEKRQTWADKIMQTVVVRVNGQAGPVQPGYPQQPGVPQLPGYGQ